jgi:GntR family L-lactate dehydrogenase operon transcriptional regulator
MLSSREHQEYAALQIISGSITPVGSGYLCKELGKLGIHVSEATAGRILNRFDKWKWTSKVGFQGRKLTDDGLRRMEELGGRTAIDRYGGEFSVEPRSQSREELIDLLIARKAIERELARLAAFHATEEEIAEMWKAQKDQFEAFSRNASAVEMDMQFHMMVAKASRNPVLCSAIGMIRKDNQAAAVLEHIRKEVHSVISYDHWQIIKAIESRDAGAAEAQMLRHIEGIIDDVNQYWKQMEIVGAKVPK